MGLAWMPTSNRNEVERSWDSDECSTHSKHLVKILEEHFFVNS